MLFFVISQRALSISCTGRRRYFVLLLFKYCAIQFNLGTVCIFVYILIAYDVSKMVPGGRSIVVSCSFRTFDSLKQDRISAANFCNLMLFHAPMGCIRLTVYDIMGLVEHGVSCILIIPQNHGNESTLVCRFVVRKSFSILVG